MLRFSTSRVQVSDRKLYLAHYCKGIKSKQLLLHRLPPLHLKAIGKTGITNQFLAKLILSNVVIKLSFVKNVSWGH